MQEITVYMTKTGEVNYTKPNTQVPNTLVCETVKVSDEVLKIIHFGSMYESTRNIQEQINECLINKGQGLCQK